MALDPQTKALLDAMNAMEGPKLYEMPVADARIALEAISIENGSAPQPVGKVEDRRIDGSAGPIPVRIYWPESRADGLPILMFYHGGGFALGNLDSHDNLCRILCNDAHVIVVSVDYRRPPELPFPAAPDDCYAAFEWTAEHAAELGGDIARIAVAGDSAGGNLSAVVCLMAKEKSGPKVAYQVLCYPGVQMDPDYKTRSRADFGGGEYFLSHSDVRWLKDMYLQKQEDLKNPHASPLLAKDLSGLPPALVITAGYDMLRDEGKEYADRLRAAGVDTEYLDFEGTIHGFISFNRVLDAGKEALDLIASRLKSRLN
ncbi:MAG: alpha/beta hydrolase [Parvularculaceae bacterium]